MQKKQRHFFRNVMLTAFFFCLMMSVVQAAQPLWTFIPQTPTIITVAKGESVQVIYTVKNQSSKPKTLLMKPIAGVRQSTPCQLPAKGSCILTLNVSGSALQGDVLGGPALCQQGNGLQCYQPSLANILRIHLIEQPPVQQFTVTPSAGANGSVSPATAQVVNAGSSLTFTATPNAGFGVNRWLLDGNVVQNGGTNYQLNNIQANHTVEVTFNQATLSPLTQNLTLSINSPGADPALIGNPRIIRIENTGSMPANNVQVNATPFPTNTGISSNTCIGTLNAGATCDITITPANTASFDNSANPCTTPPGTEPLPTTVTVSADNSPSANISVLVLGYGCIYQGGFLFSVDDTTPNTDSIAGKVAALTDEQNQLQWSTISNDTAADSITDGLANTNVLATPAGQYPAAQACLNKSDQGFTDWFLPAICEAGGRWIGGIDIGCGTTNPNLFNTLSQNGLGNIPFVDHWSSTQYPDTSPFDSAWLQSFTNGNQLIENKASSFDVRCIRAFTP